MDDAAQEVLPLSIRSDCKNKTPFPMPHFIIDCSANVLSDTSEEQVITEIHQVAVASGLFTENDIKVRMRPFETYLVGGKTTDFIHVFGSIMQGRTEAQRAALSKAMVARLKTLFPQVPFIAMNVDEFEKSTYCNLHGL
ncbi:MAG: 5-carboxymethyl-2-hydroxymuconate Delta-isomerase [Roseivirga sp.]